MLRSIGSVVLGYVTLMVLVLAFDFLMLVVVQGPSFQAPPPDRVATVTLIYCVGNLTSGWFWGAVAGYVTAWVARRRELLHAGVLAGLSAAVAALQLAASIAAPDKEQQAPLWYQAALVVVVSASVPLGGMLRARHVRERGLAPELQ